MVRERVCESQELWLLMEDKDSLKEKMRKDVLAGCAECASSGARAPPLAPADAEQ